MSAPRVSVLLPTRDDDSETLNLTLASLARALDPHDEVVLVRHGSTRRAHDRIEAAGDADARVRIVDVERDADFAEALNIGAAACRAPYIARMDGDDLMHPQRLHADVAHLDARPQCDVVASQVRLFPRPHPGHGMARYIAWQNAVCTPGDIAREAWIEQPLCHPTATFRAEVLTSTRYRAGTFPEDYDLFMRLLDDHCIEKRSAVHHGWRMHEGQATWTDPRYHRDAFAKVKVAAMVRRHSITSRPVLIAGAGKEGGRIGRALLAAGVAPAVYFDIAERRVGRVRHGAPIVEAARLAEMRAAHAGAFFIGAVGTSGARPVVRAQMRAAGFVEGEDAVIVA